jgi:alpha-galactosidase
MPKITMIGAGSAVFARQIITDVLAVDSLETGTFALVDIDPVRLELARKISQRLVELTGKHWKVEASTDRREVLPGTDYVVNSIEVAGLENDRALATPSVPVAYSRPCAPARRGSRSSPTRSASRPTR